MTRTLDKALERALHIEAVTRIEGEDNEPRVSAIQSNEETQIVNSIDDLVRKLQTNQSNRQDNQEFSSQGARPKEFQCGCEHRSRETVDSNRNYNSYNRSSVDNRRTNCDSRVRSSTSGGKYRSRGRSHESQEEQSKTVVSFEGEKWRRCGQRNHASKECRNCFECGSPNHFKRNCVCLNKN